MGPLAKTGPWKAQPSSTWAMAVLGQALPATTQPVLHPCANFTYASVTYACEIYYYVGQNY